MKRLLFTCVAVMIAVFAFAQGEETVKDLKREKEGLQLNTQLNNLQLDFEKEKMKYNSMTEEAASINAEANAATTDFNTSNASNTVKDAKSTMKKLEKVKKINKKLQSSQKKLDKLQKKINKTQAKIDKLSVAVKIVEN